jgi:hypothetical protein
LTTVGKDNYIIGNWNSAGGGIFIQANNIIGFQLFVNGTYVTALSDITAKKDVYYTVVGTYDGSSIKIYVDGKLRGQTTATGGVYPSLCKMGVGANPAPSGIDSYSSSVIDAAGVYKTTLTPDVILTNFSDNINLVSGNLYLAYDLSDSKNIKPGTVLETDNIGTMWVWIPRYAYKITRGYHSSTAGNIDIKFLVGNTDIPADGTPILSSGYVAGIKDTSTNYFVHPAFTFDAKEVTGIWVAKFEPTAAEGVANGYTSDGSCPITGDNVTTKTVEIVPNTISWRCMDVYVANTIALNMKTNVAYGWKADNVDTHAIKNTEWGAMAYLTQSVYGANNEIWINNANNYMTGCAANSVNQVASTTGCLNAYNTANGVKSSTTFNITGIYDTSGGSGERVMAGYNNPLNSSVASKYVNKYTTLSANMLNGVGMDYDSTVYGDAIYESSIGAARYSGSAWVGSITSSWYTDKSYIPFISASLFIRGGTYTEAGASGLFAFSITPGALSNNQTFRPVLIVK